METNLHKKRLSVSTWLEIRDLYVYGIIPEDGKHYYPTYKELGDKFDLHERSIYRKCRTDKTGNWNDMRVQYAVKVQDRVADAKSRMIAKKSASFDALNLQLSQLLQRHISSHLSRTEDKVDEVSGRTIRVLAHIDPVHLQRLSGTLSATQQVGRLALGESTETIENKSKQVPDLHINLKGPGIKEEIEPA